LKQKNNLLKFILNQHKQSIFFVLFVLFPNMIAGQTDHLLFVTSDGIRWQEIFEGADSALLFNPKLVKDTAAYSTKYWAKTPNERRQKLMPFLWSIVVKEGQIHGNRRIGSRVDMANQIRISYPGYAEILTGRADLRIFDNHPWYDKHPNFLQHLAKKPQFNGKIGVFTSWSNLYLVLNGRKANFKINAGSTKMPIKNWKKDPPPEDTKFWSPAILHTINRHDTITWRLAEEYFEKETPKILYISLMETDLIAHEGDYAGTLDAIHRLDSLIAVLWTKMQANPEYHNRTALFLTTDHGRGQGGFMGNWKLHNHLTRGSGQIWFAMLSPELLPLGEVVGNGNNIKAKQFASTISDLLGVDFKGKKVAKSIIFKQ
jgi:hypothetical protein